MKAIMYIGNTMFEIDAKRIDLSLDGVFVKITDTEGNEFETSPHNVILIKDKTEKGNNND